tara:strand:+ start:11846 stop:12145 length:300 start_codon:yes stop_codon:yes gene_type:complete
VPTCATFGVWAWLPPWAAGVRHLGPLSGGGAEFRPGTGRKPENLENWKTDALADTQNFRFSSFQIFAESAGAKFARAFTVIALLSVDSKYSIEFGERDA